MNHIHSLEIVIMTKSRIDAQKRTHTHIHTDPVPIMSNRSIPHLACYP